MAGTCPRWPSWHWAIRASSHTSFLPGQSASHWQGKLQAGLFWQTFAIKHFVFGMSRVQEKCLLAGDFPVFFFFNSKMNPGAGSFLFKRWP